MSWHWPKVIWAISRSLEGKWRNPVLVNIFRMEKHWQFLLQTKIAYDLGICHGLNQGHLGKLKVIDKKRFLSGNLKVKISHKDLLWPVNMHWPWVICASSRSLLEKMVHLLLSNKELLCNYIFLAGVSFVSLFKIS